MKISIDLKKTVDQNASTYFEKAKKARSKIAGAQEAVEKAQNKLIQLEKKNVEEKKEEKLIPKTTAWYHKFRWFYSSEGYLCIGGRDATTNEIVVKKHTDPDDIVFHTDMSGSPFFVVKQKEKLKGAKKQTEQTLREAADATVTFSRAWKLGLSTTAVFHVAPEQLSKTPQSGEYIAKGSFIVRGKTNYLDNKINAAIGIFENQVMCGPVEAISKHCKEFLIIIPGPDKPSKIAKIIQKKLKADLDSIIRAMPAGNCALRQ